MTEEAKHYEVVGDDTALLRVCHPGEYVDIDGLGHPHVVVAEDHDRIVTALRDEVERLGRDARRYAVIREFMAPRYLSDRLGLEWRDIPKSQTIEEKIDELCDSALENPQ